MSGIHDAVFGSVAKWAGPRDAELAAVMRWLQEEQQQQGGGGGGGGGGGDGALRRVCGVPDRLLSADLGPAASCLSSVLSCRCPLEMMGCLRGANHAILRAVADVSREEERTRREERRLRLLEQQEDEDAEEAWGGGGGGGGGDAEEEEPMRGGGGEPDELRQVSADELLPLFIASLAAAAPPQAFSALEYLLTFHQEGDLHGHGGYMLAMLEASMRFLLQFHAKGLVNRQRLGAPAASSSSLLPSASAQRTPHHQRTHQMSPHLHHGHPGAPPPSASWPSGAPEPPPGLSVHPVDDGPPTDPRAGSLPSLTLMGGDYSSIDRASKIFFNSIGKRHLGGAPNNAAAAAAAGGTAALMGLGDSGLGCCSRGLVRCSLGHPAVSEASAAAAAASWGRRGGGRGGGSGCCCGCGGEPSVPAPPDRPVPAAAAAGRPSALPSLRRRVVPSASGKRRQQQGQQGAQQPEAPPRCPACPIICGTGRSYEMQQQQQQQQHWGGRGSRRASAAEEQEARRAARGGIIGIPPPGDNLREGRCAREPVRRARLLPQWAPQQGRGCLRDLEDEAAVEG